MILTLCGHCDDPPVGSPAAAGTGHAKDCAHTAAAAVHVAAHARPADCCAWLLGRESKAACGQPHIAAQHLRGHRASVVLLVSLSLRCGGKALTHCPQLSLTALHTQLRLLERPIGRTGAPAKTTQGICF